MKQFNPSKINKCKIVGYKCLFEGNKSRLSRNYIQTIYAIAPRYWPSGGAWSLIVMSLTSLYEDYEHLQNIWTKSNVGLPLVQYKGVTFKFYQSEFTDYVVTYDRCWPMVDTELVHCDSCPSRMIQKHHKIVIPSRKTRRRRKPYKKIFVRPPAQMQTKWYFQRDICKIPLVMLTTCAVDLRFPFNYPDSRNNTTRIQCLSPTIFKNPNFAEYPITTGYSPKKNDQNQSLYLYASLNTNITELSISTITQLTPLTNTKDFQMGQPFKKLGINNKTTWGNPFYYHYLNDQSGNDNYTIYISTASPTTIQTWLNTQNNDSNKLVNPITQVTGPILYEVSYNPAKDDGKTNKAYIVSNSSIDSFKPPDNENHIIEGFPLFIMFWGWIDWLIKIKQTVSPEKYQIIVFESKVLDPQLPLYIPLDYDFTEGYDPYYPFKGDHPHTPNIYNKEHWYPKILFQQQQIEKLCQSGPSVPRPIDNVYLQGFCKYKFHFKWGGCPKQLEKVNDPCLQPIWTTTDKLTGRVEISNPNQAPQTELYAWDWDEDYVKERAIQRIKQYTTTDQKIVFSTANKNEVKALKKDQQKDTPPQEEEKELFQQLFNLRQQRLLLQQQIQLQLK